MDGRDTHTHKKVNAKTLNPKKILYTLLMIVQVVVNI